MAQTTSLMAHPGYAIFIGPKYIDGDGVDVDVIIDELTFWNRALSEREVNALYCQHNPTGCYNLSMVGTDERYYVSLCE